MPTNGHDHEELVVLPPNALDMRTTGVNNNNNINNFASNARDSLLYAMFYSSTLGYARVFPRSMRRLIEFVFLLKAVLSFFVLVYVHMNFLRMPANCLDHVKDAWPRDGILRVEIIRSYQRSYAEQTCTINDLFTVEKSYDYEYKLKRIDSGDEQSTLLNRFTKTNNPENKREVDIEPSTEELDENKFRETSTPKPNFFNHVAFTNNLSVEGIFYKKIYIVEYALEYGFLCLDHNDRTRLGIPVMLVALEPTRNKCFGDSVGQFFLEYFLGYDDLLMSSVKSLVENEQNKGFLRNVFTGAHYRVLGIWNARTSYIASFFIMVVITVFIYVAIGYLHHQSFVFMVYMMPSLNFRDSLSFPAVAVPLLTSLTASLIGLEAIMSTFFNDTNTVLHIVIIVCVAIHYDTICCHCPITKRHWLKFFYLYYFSFYAYHYRFNGQYSNLALICSWFFIQHSMFYFYHHYELPFVLQQAQLQQVTIQRQQQQHHHQHQPTGGDSFRFRNPMRLFVQMNELNNLGRLRTLLLRRRVGG